MVFRIKCHSRSVAAGICLFVLTLLLVACGGHTNSNTGSTGNSSSNSGSTTNAVQHVATPTATATPTVTYKTYTGTDFTIKYPQSWKMTTSNNEVVFTDPVGNYNMTIGATANPQGATTSAELVDGGVSGAKTNLKNTQTVTVPQTTTLDSQTWEQRSLSGTSTLNGQSSDVETVVLATNHPTKTSETKGYVIVYVANKDQFSQADSMYFQPMLQSFKFNS